ncbi:hypothetical protein ACFQY0_09570 [Haloferula chungangensis]|uniref:Serine protease n=1 Tax=Haloferula chungangensis TaxID=1048331 RepID=A0ABW2L4X9_9BACT
MRHHLPVHLATLLAMASASHAMQLRSYSSSRHDRFTGFPDAPVIRNTPIYEGNQFLGVGWRASAPQWQFVLVTRSHLLFATHAAPPIGAEICFLSGDAQVVSRTIAARTVITNSDGSASDLILLELNSPIERSQNVPPLPYLDLGLDRRYLQTNATVFGKTARVGSAVYDEFVEIGGSGLNKTSAISFPYVFETGGEDDARLESGDSGSPQFAEVDGFLGLVAINSAIETEDQFQSNLGSFVPHYIEQLNYVLSPRGYRMTPTHGDPTELEGSFSVTTSTPRQGNPLSISVTLHNTGGQAAGNLEAEFHFPAGGEPDSISGPSWVETSGSDRRILRLAEIDTQESSVITLTWLSAPLMESLDWSVDWRSDKSPDGSLIDSLSLGPSYHAWAAELVLGGQDDDPDGDQRTNLLEYAFGSDPEDGRHLLANGESSQLSMTRSGSHIILSFPERDDAAVRGLTYSPEWSQDLQPGSWSGDPPAALSSSAAPYLPNVPGFLRRTISWRWDDRRQFARITISLSE